jgi:hypothetical protein
VAVTPPAVTVLETDGRLFIRFTGPDARTLRAALRTAFRGHRRLYRTSSGAYRLWARDRERLGVWLEVWCGPGSVEWVCDQSWTCTPRMACPSGLGAQEL